MILQTDKRLNKSINKYGCYFFCILFLGVKYTKYPLSTGKILDLYLLSVDSGYMDDECYIEDPDGIFFLLGLLTKYTGKHESRYYSCGRRDIEILKYERKDGSPHFVVGNRYGKVAFDPMGTSKAVRDGYLQSKRIFRLVDREVV